MSTQMSIQIYYATEKRGFDLKSNFYILLKTYGDKMQMRSMGKNPINYGTVRKETHMYEQKPVDIDDFNKAEEAEAKQRIEKRKAKRQEPAENIKAIERQKKDKETKIKQKQMWNRLAELNGEIKKLKRPKQRPKKCVKLL